MDDDSGNESKKDKIGAVRKMFDPKAIVTPMENMSLPNRFRHQMVVTSPKRIRRVPARIRSCNDRRAHAT